MTTIALTPRGVRSGDRPRSPTSYWRAPAPSCPRQQHLLDLTEAQRKPMVQPHTVTDDLCGISMAPVQRRHDAHQAVSSQRPTESPSHYTPTTSLRTQQGKPSLTPDFVPNHSEPLLVGRDWRRTARSYRKLHTVSPSQEQAAFNSLRPLVSFFVSARTLLVWPSAEHATRRLRTTSVRTQSPGPECAATCTQACHKEAHVLARVERQSVATTEISR